MDCINLFNQISHEAMKHFFREANECADVLAKKWPDESQDFIIFHSPPADICI